MAGESLNPRMFIALIVIALFVIITFALTAATLSRVNKGFNEFKSDDPKTTNNPGTTPSLASTTITTTTQPPFSSLLIRSINIDDLIGHLNQLERIANESSSTRAVGTPGFNKTVDYIHNHLTNNVVGLNVFREPVPVRSFAVINSPVFISYSDGTVKNYTYSTNLARSDFTYVNYSGPASLTTNYTIAVISGFGCSSGDWQNASNRAALVIRGGSCTFADKGVLAAQNNASVLLFYNDGLNTANLAPVSVRLRQRNTLPSLFLSFAAGQALVDATQTNEVTVSLSLQVSESIFYVDNICADTVDGNKSQTIVIGSHSDSVPAGPGINDNGK
jgi:hypothetical protein